MAIDTSRSHVSKVGLRGDYFALEYDTRDETRQQTAWRLRDLNITLQAILGYKRLRVRYLRKSVKITVRFDPDVAIMFPDGQIKQYIGITEAVAEERLGMDPARDDGIE